MKQKLIDVYQGEQISQKERLALSAHRVGLKLPEEERVPRKPLDTVTLTPQS